MFMPSVLILALFAALLLLLVAVGVIGFLFYRFATVQAGHAAAAEAARRASEQALAAELHTVLQAAEAQVQQARAEIDTVKQQSAAYLVAELQTRTAALQRHILTSAFDLLFPLDHNLATIA